MGNCQSYSKNAVSSDAARCGGGGNDANDGRLLEIMTSVNSFSPDGQYLTGVVTVTSLPTSLEMDRDNLGLRQVFTVIFSCFTTWQYHRIHA